MEPVEIIIADQNISFARKIARLLSRHREIHVAGTCSSGSELIRMCLERRPDAVLMDIVLEDIDGFSVLKELSPRLTQTAFIVYTAFSNDITISRAYRCGASSFLCKPVDMQSLCSAITECVSAVRIASVNCQYEQNHADSLISETLSRIGILRNYEGYEFIRCAIKLIMGNPELIQSVTKQLYPRIAGMFNCSPACVERNIRTVISKSQLITDESPEPARHTNKSLLKMVIKRIILAANII